MLTTDAKDTLVQPAKKWFSLRKVLFLLSIIGTCLMLYPPLQTVLWGPEARSDYYDHIQVIPFMSAALFYWKRNTIFADVRYLPQFGIPLVIIGISLYASGLVGPLPLGPNVLLSWMAFFSLFTFVGAFIFLFGTRSFWKARFPLFFLAFMVPIPHVILEHFIYILQVASAETTDLLFSVIGVPYYREGFFFYFPGVAIEVAKECSGIRSSLALVVTGVLAAHLFLDRGWKWVILVLSIFPITVLKNGIRIITITLLANYIDIRFLTKSWLHHSGGFVFYIPALALLGLEIWALRKWPHRLPVQP
jgi:exosortase